MLMLDRMITSLCPNEGANKSILPKYLFIQIFNQSLKINKLITTKYILKIKIKQQQQQK